MTKIYCSKSTLETDNLSFSKNRYQNYMKHPHVLFKFRKTLQTTFWFLPINYLTAWLNLTTTIYSIILHCKSCWCLYLASTRTIKANCVKLSQGPGLCRTGVLVSFHKQKNKGNAPLILNSAPYTLTLLELFIFIFSEATLNPPPAHRNFTPSLKPRSLPILPYLVGWFPCTSEWPPHALLEQTWCWPPPSDPSRHEEVCCEVFSPKWKRDVISAQG